MPKQLADLEEGCGLLWCQIQRWCEIQLVYMACVGALLAVNLTAEPESVTTGLAESTPLYLPSSIATSLWETPALSALIERETCLCIAQAEDFLVDVCCQCQIISGLWQFK